MTSDQGLLKAYCRDWATLWDRFWFTPKDPAVLGALRILVGGMIFYTHLVWSLELQAFFGPNDAMVPSEYRSTLGGSENYLWSHFDWIGSSLLWPCHILALVVFALFTLGWMTKVTGVLSALFVISYANRATGAQFGLDQINGFLALYLAIGPSGQFLSLDRKLAGQGSVVNESVMANVAVRLIQVHVCIVYLFAGMGKLLGDSWWSGEAIWGALANYEYQTVDMTWMAGAMWLVNIVTYVSLAWEVSYPFLIWPKLTRPLFLIMAIIVHIGIGLCMGMLTFGLIMVFANMAFVSSHWYRSSAEKFLPNSWL